MLGLASKKKTEKIGGGEVIARMLAAEGVDTVFGIIDGTYFGFYSRLVPNGIRLISPRHEAIAAHMAGAYARLTGRLGVCMASNGPGVANMLTGIAVEHTEGNRVLVITSCRRTGASNPDRVGTFQCFPHTAVTAPITKWAQSVPSAQRLPEFVRKALRACFSGRPGVVHLDVPEDIINGAHPYPADWQVPPGRYRNMSPVTPSAEQIEQAADMLIGAQRPMIHAGSGIMHALAHEELATVAQLLHAPITTSWAGRGATSELPGYAIPLIYIGLTNRVRNEADCVLALGSRLGETDWWGKPPYWRSPAEQRMIQVDIDPSVLGLNKPLDLAIVADLKAFLRALAARLRERRGEIDVARRRAWLDDLQDERARARARLDKHLAHDGTPVHSARVVHLVRQLTDGNAILVLDGGNTAVWGHFFHEVRSPNTMLTTWKMGMLGAGMGQALGAAAAFADRQVVALMGDGAMAFHIQELETAVRNRLRVIYVVFCDRAWGMVKMGQQIATHPLKALVYKKLDPDQYINTDFDEIRFDRVAEAMGAHGERVDRAEAFAAAFERCLQEQRPSVIHVEVDRVKHMWAPGLKEFKDMHAEPAGV